MADQEIVCPARRGCWKDCEQKRKQNRPLSAPVRDSPPEGKRCRFEIRGCLEECRAFLIHGKPLME